MLKLADRRTPVVRPAQPKLASLAAGMNQSALRELLGLASAPGVLSFSVGLPATTLFPAEQLRTAAERVLSQNKSALQYGLPSEALKAHIAKLMKRRGVECDSSQIFLTAGAQQGMDLIAHLLLEPGGQVMLEETIYDGIQMALKPLRPKVLTVPTSARHGIDVDAVEAFLESGDQPAFLYLIPEGHNPTGSSLSLEKRQRLVEIARTWGLPLVEDDAYGMLTYDGVEAPPLLALDRRWVFYLGSFSKILVPGLRVGWVVAPAELVSSLSSLKHAADLDTTNLNQHLLASYLDSGEIGHHLELLRQEYRLRRDTMLAALERSMPRGMKWSRPSAGFFVWAELPGDLDAVSVLKTAVAQAQVAFSPGMAFSAPGVSDHCMRLSFAGMPPERIEEGISRLGQVIASFR
jgi:2-aminoadipate transaminase